MKDNEEIPAKPEKNYRIRFRDEDQLALIKKAAAEQGIPFNTFVIETCETTARVLLKSSPRDGAKVISNAVHVALTER